LAYKVLLVNPCYQSRISSIAQISVGPPLGLAYMAAMLNRLKGVDIRIIDANALAIPDDELCRSILDISPDIVGFTATTPTIDQVGRILNSIKASNRKILTLIGGIHATLMPYETLKKYESIDFLIYGEGEYTFLELIKALKDNKDVNGIKGLFYRDNGKLIRNSPRSFIKNLDELPFPARDLLPNHLYKSPDSKNFTCIIAIRGCPARCIYCAVRKIAGSKLRKRSPKNVVDEIEECYRNYNTNFFSFLDDTFTYDNEWVMKLCNEIRNRGLNNKIKWICLTRVDCINEGLVRAMKEAGCYKIELGVESGAPEILEYIKKGIKLEQVKKAFQIAKKLRIKTMAFVMLNAPIETSATIEKTRKLIFELEPDFLQIAYMTPYPCTELYEECKSKGLVKTSDWEKYIFLNNIIIKNKNLSELELRRAKMDLERSFYLRPNYLIKRVISILRGEEKIMPFVWASFNSLHNFFNKK
jgi:radical SAM superfamily enzyme YgiQ (UPF0313 family)